MEKRAPILLLAILAGVCLTASSHAQPQPKRPPGQFGPAGRFGPGYQRLLAVLTEDQKTSLREAIDQQREKVREIEEKLREATRELYTAGLGEKFDEERLRQRAAVVAKWEAEMTVLRFKAFSHMKPQLSAEQISRLRDQAGDGEGGPIQGDLPRKRSEKPRDENGLPLKEQPPGGKQQ